MKYFQTLLIMKRLIQLFLMFKKAVLLLFIFVLITACEQDFQQPLFQYVLENPVASGTRYPNLYKDNEGVLYMSWMSPIEEDIAALEYSTYHDGLWTVPKAVLIDTDFFTNWADFPSVIGYDGTELAAHRLEKIEGGTYAYNVRVSFYNPQTGHWDEPITPHQDNTATEHGFVSLEPINSDKVLAVWLDGRETADRADDEYSDTSKSMTIRSAEISRSGEITNSTVIDSTVCDCCQTDLAKTDEGYVAVYRGRTADEIRDIKIARYDTKSGAWSEPISVHDDNWEIMACPVNGPRVEAKGSQVVVVWFTAEGDNPRVLMTRSSDGGRTFGEPVRINQPEYTALGRVDLAMADDGTLYVSWMQEFEEKGYVMMRKIEPDGTVSNPQTVGITGASRASGFPRVELVDNSLIFAWTQTDPLVRVRTAKVDLND